MEAHQILAKTPKGEAEIASRAHGIHHQLRYALILVDGKSTVLDILNKGSGLPNIETALEQLYADGFVCPHQSQPSFSASKQSLLRMTEIVLGAQAAPILAYLRDAEDTPGSLAQAIQNCKRRIKLSIDEKKAEKFYRYAQEILVAS